MQAQNVVYKRQFIILAFFIGVVFKSAFLPAYLTRVVNQNNYWVLFSYLAVEALIFAMIYFIAKNKLISELPKAARIAIMALCFVVFVIKFAVHAGGAVFFVSNILFSSEQVIFIFLALVGLVAYIAIKGAKVNARLAELFFVPVIVLLAINLVTAGNGVDFAYNLPIFGLGGRGFIGAFSGMIMMTGDFLPLMVFTIKDSPRKTKIMPWVLGLTFCMLILHYVFLNAVFRAGAASVDNVIVELGSFNVGSMIIGRTDIIALMLWFVMTIISLALYMYAAVESSSHFIKDRRIGAGIVVVTMIIMYVVGITNANRLYEFTASGLKWFTFTVQILAPLVVVSFAFWRKRIRMQKAEGTMKNEKLR